MPRLALRNDAVEPRAGGRRERLAGGARGPSPVIAWMAYVGNPMFGELRAMSPAAAYAVGGLALISVAAGALWTIAVPGRGPHDRVAGTWVVPR